MSLADKVAETLTSAFHLALEATKDILVKVVGGGIELILDIIGKGLRSRMPAILDIIDPEHRLSDERREAIMSILVGEGEWTAVLGGSAAGSATGGLVSSTIGPFLKLIEYQGLRRSESARLTPEMAARLYWLDPAKYVELVTSDLADQGWTRERRDAIRELARQPLPLSILKDLKYRFNYSDERLVEELQRAGITNFDAHYIVQALEFFPSAQDLITWTAKEVFEPDSIKRYGLDDEFDRLDLSLFLRAGITPEQARNYWIAHWQHASWNQVIEMLHRGQLTEEEVWEWFRLVEIPPFWRQKLINISWNVPTRVDVRRWWDMRTITPERLRQLYQSMGYHGEDLEDYVLWTYTYTELPSLLTRYENGWITLDDVRREMLAIWTEGKELEPEKLQALKDRLEIFIQEKVEKPAGSKRVQKEKDLTVSMIVEGIKKNKLTRQQGIELIQRLGYDEWESEYIVDIRVEAQGSPETPLDFRALVESYRKARRMEHKEIPPRLLELEKEIIALKNQRASAIASRRPQAIVDKLNADIATLEYKLIQLAKSYQL
jgi:hypothetical protein